MAFPNGSLGLVPWMNGRVDAGPGGALPYQTSASFAPGGTITFQWIEDGTFTNPFINIYAHSRWAGTIIDHRVLVQAVDAYPGSTTHTPANRTALQAITPVAGQTALVATDSSYWIAIDGYWIRMVQNVTAGTVSAYGVTATVYTATLPQSDIPQYNGIGFVSGQWYDLCWQTNNLHAPQYDASFNIQPLTPPQGVEVNRCALCGIKLKKPRPQNYWPNGKPKCAMQ